MINIRLSILTVISVFSVNCFGQTTFQKVIGIGYSSVATAVRPTNDGGYILTGYANIASSDSSGIYLIKTNSQGEVAWSKTFRVTDGYGYAVQQTYDGGFIIAGSASEDTLDQYIYIIKTDASGDTVWTKTYGGVANEFAYNIQQTMDSGYIVTGSTNSFGAGGDDMYLLKLSTNGAIEWTKTYGGSSDDDGQDVKQTADSGYIVFGTTLSFGAGNRDFYLIKTNSNGDTLWTKTYGGSAFEVATSVWPTFDGGYILAGYTSSFGVSGGGIYIVKTNSTGDTLWTKTYDGVYFEVVKEIQQTADSGYILSGYTNSAGLGIRNAFLIKTNSLGDSVWTSTYGGYAYEDCYSVRQTPDGGYIAAGSSSSFGSYQNGAVYLVKTDKDGNSNCYQDITGFVPGHTNTVTQSTNTIVQSGGYAGFANTIVGSGAQDSVLCLISGIEVLREDHNITIYPNPSWNIIQVNAAATAYKTGKATLYISNVLGQTVSPPLAFHPDLPVDVSSLAPGIYFLHIYDDSQSWVGKFVKQ